MAEYFAGGSLHYQDGEWRDDNGNVVEIEQVRHAHWTGKLPMDEACAEGFADWFTEEDKKAYLETKEHITHCSNCLGGYDDRLISGIRYCKFCGAKINGGKSSG